MHFIKEYIKTILIKKKTSLLAWLLILPAFITVFLTGAYPLIQVFYNSVTNKGFAKSSEVEFVGFENYTHLLSFKIKELEIKDGTKEYISPIDTLPREPIRYKEVFQFDFFGKKYVVGSPKPDFLLSVWNTILFTIISVFLETVSGLIIALSLYHSFKGEGVLRAVILIPWAFITVVSAKIWEYMLVPNRTGFFNMLFSSLNIGDGQIAFLSNEKFQLVSLIFIDVWKTTPFMTLILLAGLYSIPKNLYMAATVDGASKVRQFFVITLPLLRPALTVALIFRTLDALRVFDLFHVLLSNKRFSMASYAYQELIYNREMGMASAVSVVIFAIILFFSITYIKTVGMD